MAIVIKGIQLIVVSIFIYLLSGRLLGTKLNFFKRFFSTFVSVVLTTFVFWYTYFRHNNYLNQDLFQQVSNVSTLLWMGSMLLISMLLYLVFELFDPKQQSDFSGQSENIFVRLRSNFYRKKRLAEVFRIAFRQGIGKALQYKRSYENDRYIAIMLRNIMEESGGIFIKFGQMLSTRGDILPAVFVEEFSKLQQNVKPMPIHEVEQILKRELGHPIDDIFSHFEKKPLAAGSIGQVHRAILKKNDEEVVLKILRSEVTRIMNRDLDILIHFAAWLEEESSWAGNLGFLQLAHGFAASLREEINFEIERQNMEQISNALKPFEKKVLIPKVYPQFSNRKLLVMEYMKGQPITKAHGLLMQHHKDIPETLANVYTVFLEQLLIAGVFHADPHPGNIFIAENTGEPIYLDFGAVGRLGALQNRGLKTLLIGIATNDAKVMVSGLDHLVIDDEIEHRDRLEQDLSQLLISIQYVDKIPTELVVQKLFEIMRIHELKLYPMVSVALRALITIDGTLSTVDPKYDVINGAKEFAVMHRTDLSPLASIKDIKTTAAQEIALLLPELKDLPRRFERIVRHFEKGEMGVKMDLLSDSKTTSFLSHWASLFILLIVAVTFGVISVALLAIAQFIDNQYAVYVNTASFIGLFLSAVILVRLSVQALKHSKRID